MISGVVHWAPDQAGAEVDGSAGAARLEAILQAKGKKENWKCFMFTRCMPGKITGKRQWMNEGRSRKREKRERLEFFGSIRNVI